MKNSSVLLAIATIFVLLLSSCAEPIDMSGKFYITSQNITTESGAEFEGYMVREKGVTRDAMHMYFKDLEGKSILMTPSVSKLVYKFDDDYENEPFITFEKTEWKSDQHSLTSYATSYGGTITVHIAHKDNKVLDLSNREDD